jgi:tRNA A-37 threonylcarbamoyl transferase component Bud32
MIDPDIIDLVVQLEELERQSKPQTPEELCRRRPELLEPLKQALHLLGKLNRFIQEPETGLNTGTPRPGPSATGTERPAPASGRYQPVRLHAEGGLGVVFEAEDTELNRVVALKRLKERFQGDADMRGRFLQEAEVTGRLEHPGVVPVYGMGQDAEGQLCYAMRFIRGETLQQAIHRFHAEDLPSRDPGERNLALRQLLSHFVAVCNTVAYAHSRGILHRDLKPGNVMLGKYGETLVVDWGLAKPFDRDESARSGGEETLTPVTGSDSSVTQYGQAMGTPAYMSPEQAEGRWDVVGPGSDVYSLGAILYAVLAGVAPFKAGRDLLERVKRGDFPPPGQVKQGIAPALQSICLRSMAARPEDRYATALDLAAEVERWLADEPVHAYREGMLERFGRWARRHRTLTAATAALLAAGVLGGVGGTVWTEGARRAESEQRARAEEARREADARAQAESEARAAESEAGRGALRTALAGYHAAADASLAEARGLGEAPARFNRRQEALKLLAGAASLEETARTTLAQLGDSAGELAQTEPRAWRRRREELRDESIRWLTHIGLARARSVLLPPPPANQEQVLKEDRDALSNEMRDQAIHLPWSIALALSSDRSRLAVAYRAAVEMWLVPTDGAPPRRLPLPAAMSPIRLSFAFDSLRFTDDNHLEMITTTGRTTWDLPTGRPTYRAHTPKEAEEVKQRIAALIARRRETFYRWTGPEEALLASSPLCSAFRTFSTRSPRESRLTVRRHADHSSFVAWQSRNPPQQADEVLFGDDPRFLCYLTGRAQGQRLAVVDLSRGLTAWQSLAGRTDQASGPSFVKLLGCPGGVATLEALGTPSGAVASYRMTLWEAEIPRAWKRSLAADAPIQRLDLASDGLLATSGQDHTVSLWRGSRRAWSSGVPAGDDTDVDSLYPFWGFAGGGARNLVVSRREPGADNPVRTEVYRHDDGRLLHSFPTQGPGRIFSLGPDRRHAAVVVGKKANRITLDLWSLEEGKALGRLGTYTHRDRPLAPAARAWLDTDCEVVRRVRGNNDTTHNRFRTHSQGRTRNFYLPCDVERGKVPAWETAPDLSVVHSPSGRWMLILDRPASRMEIWRLPEGKLAGTVPLPGAQVLVVFDGADKRVLLAGPSYGPSGPPYDQAGHKPFGRVIDLETSARVCDLLDLEPGWPVDSAAFRFTADAVIVVERGNPGGIPLKVTVWDARTGWRTNLPPGKPRGQPGKWRSRGVRLRLGGGDTRLLLESYWEDNREHLAWLQLWDLPGKRLLREATMVKRTWLIPGVPDLAVAVDRDKIYLSEGKEAAGESWSLTTGPARLRVYETIGGKRPALISDLRPSSLGFVREHVYWKEGYPTARRQAKLTCWRWSDGAEVEGRPDTLLTASEDGRWALWGGAGGVKVEDGSGGKSVRLRLTSATSYFRAATADRRFIVLETSFEPQGRSGVWNALTGKRTCAFPDGHRFRTFDPTGRFLATIDTRRGEIQVRETETGQLRHRLRQPSLVWDPPGLRARWSIHYADLDLRPTELSFIDLRLHAGGDRLALFSRGLIQLHDLAGQHLLATIPTAGHLTPPLAVAQHSGAGLVASAGLEGLVLLRNRRDGRILHALPGDHGAVYALAFSPDGRYLACGAQDGAVCVRETKEGRIIWSYRDPRPARIRSLAYRPGTAILVAGTQDGRALFLDAGSGKVLDSRSGDGSAMLNLAFTRDGGRLALGTAGGAILVHELDRRQAPTTIATGAANGGLAFTPGGLLVSGDESVRFWSPAGGKAVLTVPVQGGPVRALALSADGHELVLAVAGTVQTLDLRVLKEELLALGLDWPGEQPTRSRER